MWRDREMDPSLYRVYVQRYFTFTAGKISPFFAFDVSRSLKFCTLTLRLTFTQILSTTHSEVYLAYKIRISARIINPKLLQLLNKNQSAHTDPPAQSSQIDFCFIINSLQSISSGHSTGAPSYYTTVLYQ